MPFLQKAVVTSSYAESFCHALQLELLLIKTFQKPKIMMKKFAHRLTPKPPVGSFNSKTSRCGAVGGRHNFFYYEKLLKTKLIDHYKNFIQRLIWLTVTCSEIIIYPGKLFSFTHWMLNVWLHHNPCNKNPSRDMRQTQMIHHKLIHKTSNSCNSTLPKTHFCTKYYRRNDTPGTLV